MYGIGIRRATPQKVRECLEHTLQINKMVPAYVYAYKVIPGDIPRLKWVSEAFFRVTGYMVEDLQKLGWERLYHPEDQQQLQERCAAMQRGVTDVRNWRIVTKKGEIRWMHDVAYMQKNRHNKSGWLCYGYALDITEQKQAEQYALQQTQRLEAIFETITDAVIVYDANGKILMENAASLNMLGLQERPHIQQLTIWERIPYLKLRDMEGRPLPFEERLSTRILRGEVVRGSLTIDVQLTTLDGRDLCVNGGGAPIIDEQGRATGYVLIFRDITERKNRELRTAKTLDTLLKMAEALVLFADPEELQQEETLVSRQQIIRQQLELIREVLGSQTAGIVMIEDGCFQPIAAIGLPDQFSQLFWQTLSGTRIRDCFNEEQWAQLSSGKAILMDVCNYDVSQLLIAPVTIGERLLGLVSVDHSYEKPAYPLPEAMTLCKAAGKLTGLVMERECLIQERAKAYANAIAEREANREKDAFLGLAGHELRTPLTTIKGSIQLARRTLKRMSGATEPEAMVSRVDELLERAERQILVEDRLVGDLLDVSRIQQNRLELRLRRVNLLDIVRRVVGDIQAGNAGRTIEMKLPAETEIPVQVDADRIGQVLTNYLTNAIKYTPSEKPVEAWVEIKGTVAYVSVRDRGPGLDEEQKQRIWERFYQLPGRIVYSGSVGMGLGLYICQMIIKQHNGEVGVESRPGQGSSFWFTLAIASEQLL